MILSPVILDTNVIISALVFDGKPGQALRLLRYKEYSAVISPPLLAELIDVLRKKFYYPPEKLHLTEKKITTLCSTVYPKEHIDLLDDIADNRLLEAAIEGKCHYIVTGDKELLRLNHFRNIQIVTTHQFLQIIENETPRAKARGIYADASRA
ncbi:putative toxin-antitoxin system toxin component, PIN family [Candidatus Gottesmanbacteria bacterium]|nr:putative toxin-antitoxin system toxin component, PIN family [Candidatus Gottesmanbacteria bacterium]